MYKHTTRQKWDEWDEAAWAYETQSSASTSGRGEHREASEHRAHCQGAKRSNHAKPHRRACQSAGKGHDATFCELEHLLLTKTIETLKQRGDRS